MCSWRRREFVSGGEFILQNQVTVVLFAMSHLEQLPPSSLPAGRRDHYMLFIDTHEEFGLHFVVPCLCRYGRVDRTLLIPTFTTNVTVSLCPFCLSHSFFLLLLLSLSLYLPHLKLPKTLPVKVSDSNLNNSNDRINSVSKSFQSRFQEGERS